MRRLILEIVEEPADVPSLAYDLAIAKHNDQAVKLEIEGFTYPVRLHKVTVDSGVGQ